MLGVVCRVICQFNSTICFFFCSNFLKVCEININVDICVTEVMLFRLSYFMCYYLFIDRSKSKMFESYLHIYLIHYMNKFIQLSISCQ